MNYQLIMTNNPVLVTEGNYDSDCLIYDFANDQIIKLRDTYALTNYKKIVAGIEGFPKIDLSLVAKDIYWVDVEKLAFDLYGGGENTHSLDAFIKGFKAANNKKVFSEEDVIRAMTEMSIHCIVHGEYSLNYQKQIIKSLLKPKSYLVECIKKDDTIKVIKILK